MGNSENSVVVTVLVCLCLGLLVVISHRTIISILRTDDNSATLRLGSPGVNHIAEMIQSLGEILLDLNTLKGYVNESILHVAVNNIYDWNINQHPNFTSDKYRFRVRCGDSDELPQHMYVIRHTETIAVIPNWYELAFHEKGSYLIDDLNLPPMLPYRAGFPEAFIGDVPLSVNGHMHVWLMGHGFLERGLNVSHVYAAPSMKAVESANTFLTGMGLKLPINIEPGILGWLQDYQNITFLTAEELYWYNISINTDYEPVMTLDGMDYEESKLDEYARTGKVARRILRKHKDEGGDIVFISDLSTTETITRGLLNEPHLDKNGYRRLHNWHPALPPGVMAVLEKTCGHSSWHRVRPPVPPYTSRHVNTYNWTFMLI